MSLLYLVTESDRDASFYQKCASRLTGRSFADVQPLRNRKGDGSAAVQRQLEYALKQARGVAAGATEVCFIAAIDNDRAPHPENDAALNRTLLSKRERAYTCRRDWMRQTVDSVLGANRAEWPMRVAVAVPVEMVECWIVKALGAELPGGPTPHFSKQSQGKARDYYAPVDAPAQWKDLEREARTQCGLTNDENFYEHAACEIEKGAEALAARSLSFREFLADLRSWGGGTAQ